MVCKKCQGILPDDAKFCLHCGASCEEEQQEIVVAADEAPQLEDVVTTEEVVETSGDVKKKKGRIIAMCGCILGLAALAVVLFFGIKGEFDLFKWLRPRENNVSYKDSYYVSDKKAENQSEVVVATMGDHQLNNRKLQMYYWMEVYDFLNQYGSYAAYFGLDISKPLDEQYVDEDQTWQQYFMESAIRNWQTYTALAQEAEAKGHEMNDEYKKLLEEMKTTMQESATKAGFASVDAMLASEMGVGVTYEDYYEYLVTYYTGYSYFDHCYESFNPTDEEIDAYFEKNKETFAQQKITKESGKYVDVRHVLKLIEKYGEQDTANKNTEPNYGYTQEAWDACQAAAQKLLDEWLAGERTEESFGEMANEHSDDQGGKVTNGGIYEDVVKGKMVKPFEDWIFDESRQVGDYGLVKTQYGYHIMYFVGGEEIWYAEAKNALIDELTQNMVTEVLTKNPIEVTYKNIAIAELSFS
jgi:hypothetical protein